MQAGESVLCIVDAYNPNWGPCEMAAGHFSNLFYDEGENMGMKFVRAEATKIASLIEFRDTCEPNFAFFLNGDMIAKVTGADLVKVKSTIFEKAPKVRPPPPPARRRQARTSACSR